MRPGVVKGNNRDHGRRAPFPAFHGASPRFQARVARGSPTTWRRRVSGSSDRTRHVDRRAAISMSWPQICTFVGLQIAESAFPPPAGEGAITRCNSSALSRASAQSACLSRQHCHSLGLREKSFACWITIKETDAVPSRTNPLSLPASPSTPRRSVSDDTEYHRSASRRALSPVSGWLGVQAHGGLEISPRAMDAVGRRGFDGRGNGRSPSGRLRQIVDNSAAFARNHQFSGSGVTQVLKIESLRQATVRASRSGRN